MWYGSFEKKPGLIFNHGRVLVSIPSGQPEILEFVAQVHGRSEGENQVNWLELTVCEVACHLHDPLGLVFGKLFASQLHRDAKDVLPADPHQLGRLLNLLLRVDRQQRNGEHDLKCHKQNESAF